LAAPIFEIEVLKKVLKQITMKFFIVFILIFTTTTFSFGQRCEDKLFGRWITPEADFMLINKPVNGIILTEFSVMSKYKEGWSQIRQDLTLRFYRNSNDTLRFYRTLYSIPNTWHRENYDFEIIAQSDTSMTLIPITFYSKRLFPNNDTLNFVRQEYAVTKIHFQGLCYRYRDNILRIDSIGNVYLQKEIVVNNSSVTKRLKGKLDYFSFGEMINLLQTKNLKTLNWGSQGHSDRFETTLIIDYDNKRKKLRSGRPAPISQPLIDFLTNIETQVKFEDAEFNRIICF
jgi:hypothetical protein